MNDKTEYDKSFGIDPCPLCNGKAEMLDVYRDLVVKPSCNKSEIVCMDCGLTLKGPKSEHKMRKMWNTRVNSKKIKRLKETLHHELPDKYPDNCQVCHGENGGVKGNENIIDGIVMCDYCHIEEKK